jgi:hypothetical protein
MERVDVIMGRLGFKEEGDDSVKAAFVKNLIKQAYGVEVPLPEKYQKKSSEPTFDELTKISCSPKRGTFPPGSTQLSFNLDDEPKVG